MRVYVIVLLIWLMFMMVICGKFLFSFDNILGILRFCNSWFVKWFLGGFVMGVMCVVRFIDKGIDYLFCCLII